VLQPLGVAIVAALLLWKVDGVLSLLGWEPPSSPVIGAAHRVRELLVNMEFGLRGYLESADLDLRARYANAFTAAPGAIAELAQRVAADPLAGQEKAVASLESVFPAWSEVAGSLVAGEQCVGESASAAARASTLMDTMKSSVRAVLESEFAAAAEKTGERREAARVAIIVALGGVFLFGLGLAGLARRQLFALSRRYQELLDEQRRAMEEIRAARAHAEDANRAKDELLATVSHELRAPLHAIFAAAELLKHPFADAVRTRRAIEVIDRNMKRQARLVDDLLDVSRIVSRKVALQNAAVDLRFVLNEAVQAVRASAAAAGLTLEATIEQEPLIVLGDYGRLLQVLGNVLANAVKFTPRGGRITVSLGRREEEAAIAISDTGIGIRPDLLPKIFEPFEQGDKSSTRRHGGLGLGLAIAERLITAHNGTIRAESGGENRGTTMFLTLPIYEGPVETPTPELDAGRAAEGIRSAPLRGFRVLVVDDDDEAREAITMLLAVHGARAVAASSVDEALEKLDGFDADVVLSDVAMPGDDGYALLRRIAERERGRERRTPLVAVTAMASAADGARLLEAGFAVHVKKPLDSAELISAVLQCALPAPRTPARA
jgi:signal transduction histidine kinase/ActR/RegA family two-component response regulator